MGRKWRQLYLNNNKKLYCLHYYRFSPFPLLCPLHPNPIPPAFPTLLSVSMGYAYIIYVLWLLSSSPPHPPVPLDLSVCSIKGFVVKVSIAFLHHPVFNPHIPIQATSTPSSLQIHLEIFFFISPNMKRYFYPPFLHKMYTFYIVLHLAFLPNTISWCTF